MGEFSATLGGIPIKIVRVGAKLDDVPFAQVLAKGSRSGVPRVLSVNMNEPRALSCMAHVFGATKDELISNVAAINAKIRVGCDLVMQSTDATRSVTLKVLPSQLSVPGLLDMRFETGLRTSLPLSLSLEPYACGPETVVFWAEVTAPTIIDLDVPGDYPSPLNIYWAPNIMYLGWIDPFAMGLLPDQTTPFSSLLHAPLPKNAAINGGNPAPCTEAWDHGLFSGQTIRILSGVTVPATAGTDQVVTVTGPDSFTIPVNITSQGVVAWSPWYQQNVSWEADAGAYQDGAWQQTATGWSKMDVNDTGLPRGTYLPILRVGQGNAGGGPSMCFSQTGGEVGQEGCSAEVPSYEFHPWGKSVAAPARRIVNEAVSSFGLSMRAGGAGGDVVFNYLAMMPVSWGWLLQNTKQFGSYFLLDYDGAAYIQGYAQTGGISSGGMTAVGAQRLFFVVGGASGGGAIGELIIKVIPRYALWA